MAAETAVIGFLILLLLLLAWTIGLGGAVGLIAGYQQGDLPPDREQRLVRRVQVALLAVAITNTPRSSTPGPELCCTRGGSPVASRSSTSWRCW
ncbi:MAG: hypothetical protein ACLFMX_00940 [Halobacteriales archaeon]